MRRRVFDGCRASGLASAAVTLLVGCELGDVEIPAGEPFVVVHAVMRPDQPRQFIVVEQSFSGEVDPFVSNDAIPPNPPPTPIAGATVWVTNATLPGDTCGSPVEFREDNSARLPADGVYWAPDGCPTMRPGDRLELWVDTRRAGVVTGATTVPGIEAASLRIGTDTLGFGADTATLNRDRDTVALAVDAVAARALQVEVRSARDLRKLALLLQVDTTHVRIPGDLRDVFGNATGEEVFLGGRYYAFLAAVTDSNLFDFIRSENNPYTGRGFINRLEGGVGVFGSMAAVSRDLKVVADQDDQREGVYRFRGVLQGVDIDLAMAVYLARPLTDAAFSAFVNGAWLAIGDVGPGGAVGWLQHTVVGQSVDGRFAGDSLFVTIPTPGTRLMHLTVRGIRAAGASFGVAVADSSITTVLPLGSLEAEQVEGPVGAG